MEVCGRCCFVFVSHLFELAMNYCPPAESVLAVRVTGKCSTCIYPNHEPFQLIFSPLCCSGGGVRVAGWPWGSRLGSAHHKYPALKFQAERGVSSWQVSLLQHTPGETLSTSHKAQPCSPHSAHRDAEREKKHFHLHLWQKHIWSPGRAFGDQTVAWGRKDSQQTLPS